jgi:hypothetical protein
LPATGTANGAVTVNVAENATVETRTATVTLTAGTLTQQVAVTQAAALPVLDVDKTTIDATAAAATYSIGVTSNTAWTVAVSAGATWCTVSPATGTGDGTVTVNVEFYAEIGHRAATVTLSSATLTHSVTVAQQRDTPPYAASAQTWTFDGQTWSDVIHIPDCNKTDFTNSYTDPHCRNYTATDGKTCYYYNWPYVDANKDEMCLYPWRMPSRLDFETLISNTNSSTLISEWGYGGSVSSGYVDYVNSGDYWSSTENGTNGGYNFSNSSTGGMGIYYTNKNYGLQVRCVK